MFRTKTNISFTAVIAALGMLSALPAVSQAQVHHKAKPHAVAHKVTAVTSAVRVAAVAGNTTTTATKTVAAVTIKKVGTPAPILHPVATKAIPLDLKASSAGTIGYGGDTCEKLAGDYNKAVNETEQGLINEEADRTETYGNLANRIYGQLSDNCLITT